MYALHGFSNSELGDVEVIVHDGVLHLFHLTLPNHDVINHAVSVDGIIWEPRPPALRTGDPGSFDDDQLWTMSVIRRRDRFWMLYTALNRADEGRVQRLGLAVSDDLEVWNKLPGPVSEAAGPHYRTDRDGAPWVAWRDPKTVVLDDGRVHAVLCARAPGAPSLRQGVVGHIVSDDMATWEALPPLFSSRRHFELECPQLFPFAGRLYLTASVLEERTQRYWFSDDLRSPFEAPDDNRFLPHGHYAARICPVGDEHWVFAFHDPGGTARPKGRFVPAPLVLVADDESGLTCRRTTAWDDRAGEPEALGLPLCTPRLGAPRGRREGNAFASPEGSELFFRELPGDVLLRAEVAVDAPIFGIATAFAADGGGTLIELDRGLRRVRVVERSSAPYHGRPWFRERCVSEGAYRPASRCTIEVIRAGGELIVSIDGRVVVSTSHVPRPADDGIGFLVDSGSICVRSATVAPLRL